MMVSQVDGHGVITGKVEGTGHDDEYYDLLTQINILMRNDQSAASLPYQPAQVAWRLLVHKTQQ